MCDRRMQHEGYFPWRSKGPSFPWCRSVRHFDAPLEHRISDRTCSKFSHEFGRPNVFTLSCSARARAEAARRAACHVRAAFSGARGCQAACRRPIYSCTRGFSPGRKPGAASFSVELGGLWLVLRVRHVKLRHFQFRNIVLSITDELFQIGIA